MYHKVLLYILAHAYEHFDYNNTHVTQQIILNNIMCTLYITRNQSQMSCEMWTEYTKNEIN